MKKLLNYLLVISILLVQFVSVTKAASISISNSVKGQIYNAYKIFDVTRDGSSYAYSIQKDSEWYPVVATYAENHSDQMTLELATDNSTYVVTVTEAFNDQSAKEFAKYLDDNKSEKTPSATKEGNGDKITLDTLEAGYYFVNSSLGTLCILHTAADKMEVTEKNGVPTVEKLVKEDSTNEFGKTNSAELGQKVEYKTTITVKSGAENYVLYDKMVQGITFQKDLVVTLNDTPVDSSNYTINYDNTDYTFVLSFKNNYISTLASNSELIVTYSAVLNKEAIIEGEGNKNETHLDYGDKNKVTSTPTDITTTYVYEFDLVKTNKNNEILSGAEFELYQENSEEALKFVQLSETNNVFVYRLATSEDTDTTAIIKAGQTTIKGLDLDTYTLKETKSPTGYNKLTSTIPINVNEESVRSNVTLTADNHYESGGVEVENLTGLELPSTGGIGTILFIAIGSIMVLGFGVLLVTKLRLSKMSI